jgi:hypothetical protein
MSSCATAQTLAACGCYCGKVIRPPCSDNACKQACGWTGGSSGRSSNSSSSYDSGAAAAAAEAERQRQAEAEAERKRQEDELRRQEEERQKREAEERRRQQEEFERKKQEALDSMKGLGGGEPGLKGGSDSLGLKDLSDSDSGGLGLKDALNSPQSQKALDEANSNSVSTQHGLKTETPEGRTTGTREDASGFGRNVFDRAGDRHAASVNTGTALKNVGNPPSVKALLSHIPDKALKLHDPVIDKSIQWYRDLEGTKADDRAKIAEVQKKIDTHAGDPTTLSLHKKQLETNVKLINDDERTAENSIKKELLNLNLPWIESPPADATKEKTQ